MDRHTNVIGVHLLFEQGGHVLLGRRAPDSAYAPETWHLPASHQDELQWAARNQDTEGVRHARRILGRLMTTVTSG